LIGVAIGAIAASVSWIAWMLYACSPKRDMEDEHNPYRHSDAA